MYKKNEKVEKAEKALADFLKNNPEMQEFQDEIDRILSKIPNAQTRMEVLGLMMAGSLDKLRQSLMGLQKIAEGVVKDGTN